MRNKLLTTFVLLAMAVAMTAQEMKKVTGTVLDTMGEPMIGATVKPYGEQGGTVTDLDGKFQLNVPQGTKQLTITYIGYKTMTVNLKGNTVNVVMSEDTNMMEELVVVGYGSVKKGDVTNAVAQVKGDDLADRPVSNIASALQGELAGVEVRTTSGAPGSGVQISVRGATSINEDGTSNPLFVVDGVPMDDDFDLITLNPQDIESIEVLKDASSSAIYGSRGANGVVIITSKKGSDDGKVNVSFKADFSLSSPERYIGVMSPEEWIEWRSKSNDVRYVNNYGTQGATANDDYMTRLRFTSGTNYVNDPRWSMPDYGGLALIDWQKEIFQTAFAQSYNLSVSSGNKTSNYRASLGYVNQEGIVITTNFQRINLKLSAQTTLFDKLTIGVDLAPQFSVTKGGDVDGKDNAAMSALTMTPVAEPGVGIHTGAEPYSRYIYAGGGTSPVEVMERTKYRSESVRINASAFLRYQITKGLTGEILGSWLFNNSERHRFVPGSLSSYWASYPEGYYTTGRWNGSRTHKYLGQVLLTFDRTFGMHHLNVVAGASLENTRDGSSWTLNATQFPNDAIEGFDMNTARITTANTTITTQDRLISYFTRAEYGFDSRYLLTGSIRRDGSSRFGAKNHWGTFPAISAAWRLSNEHFWKESWVMNQAKIRVSYGVNGSNAIPVNSAYGMLTESNYSQDGNLITGYTPSSRDNEELGWQKTDSWNVGLDLGFFHNRISLAVDYYKKSIRDMLYKITLPADMGYTSGYTNVGNIENQGVELELKTENLTGKLRWTTSLSIGYNKNKVKDLGANSTIYTGYDGSTQVIEVGRTAGEYYLYDAVGVYNSEADLMNYPTQTGSVVGSVRYRDANGDGQITEADRVYMGHPQPTFTYGMTNTFKYKNWDFSFLITAQTGGKIYGALGRAFDRQGMGTSINVLKKWRNMWFSESDTGDGQTPNAWVSGISEEYDNRWLYSSDFIKLKNVNIGYRFKMPKKFYVKSIRVNASVENVFMIDNYDGGYSPESNNSTSRISSYDYGAYPQARTFNLGVNFQF
ncbi:MAG: TonB-dependent receptor [Bacteroidaceae bacterium]|nr:TonB-dependent receptor [Prevotella sp.]MBR0263110.1 TonB-dependent receptor [Prevotella sp.]MBR1542832.1 TonB-dependent receptor [Bacteroidaceae bacterium]